MIISAGNDIVDLSTIDIARTKQARFYTKFITGPELTLYSQPQLAHLPFECFVWMLWSVKESVYKFMQRHHPDLVFSPSKIIIGHIANPSLTMLSSANDVPIEGKGFEKQHCYSGTISFGKHTLYSRSIITNDYIVTLVNHSIDFEHIYWGFKLVDASSPEIQSTEVRQFILKKLTTVLKSDQLNIIKNPSGCPILYKGFDQTSVPISLSHHGKYVAYAFLFCGTLTFINIYKFIF